jgi:molybdopterin converting factor small subunit
MMVRLVLQATLRQRFPGLLNPLNTKAATVGELLDEQRIPRTAAAILFVNGARATAESAIQDGDEIRLFPLLGGG